MIIVIDTDHCLQGHVHHGTLKQPLHLCVFFFGASPAKERWKRAVR